MKKEQPFTEPTIVAEAERRMQAWVRTAEIEDRALRTQTAEQIARSIKPFLTISREAGAGGGEIAKAVGKELGWEVFDKNLLDFVAERFHLSRPMLEHVDETPSNWVHDVIGTWIDRHIIPHDKYVAHLGPVVLALSRRESVVLVGRGTQFLLPRDKGLAVRIIAPLKYRVERVMRHENLSEYDAQRYIRRIDHGRGDFVQRYFHQDINDPHLYDLVINVANLDPDDVVDHIVAAFRR